MPKSQNSAWHTVGSLSLPRRGREVGRREGRTVRMEGTEGRREASRQGGLAGDRFLGLQEEGATSGLRSKHKQNNL